jgi:hypothetical protein
MKKKVLLYSFFIFNYFGIIAQKNINIIQYLSPAYSFSSATTSNNITKIQYKSVSHGLALSLLKYQFIYNKLPVGLGMTGGVGFHFSSSKINNTIGDSVITDIKISYVGLAPEVRFELYLIKPNDEHAGVYIGTGAQFFVLPLLKNSDLQATSFRPLGLMGIKNISENGNFTGVNIFIAPPFIKSETLGIEKRWFFGVEIDLPFLCDKF